ncbi:MAG TPA: YfhO family protein, partial [Patescibacteria group bacterium]|nr:YfhO family protein [Patescibacteria group bacterium]
FLAIMKPLVFYPFTILFVFGEIPSWHVLLGGQIFLSMLFCYLLARDFKLGKLPSIIVGLSFALNSFMVGLLQFGSDAHTMVWWPLILLFGKRFLEEKKRKYLLFLAFAIAFGVLGGQLQYMGFFLLFFVAFILFYGIKLKTKPLTYFLLSVSIALGIGLTAIQLAPSVELFSHSHRGLLSEGQQQEVFKSGLMEPTHLFRLFAPDFFGNPVTRDERIGYIEGSGYFGIISLFFALFAAIFARNNVFVRFLTVTFIVTALLAVQGIGDILSLLHLPVITSGSGGRIFTLTLFSGALLSGFGIMAFLQMKQRKKQLLSLLSFVLLFILVVAFSYLIQLFPSPQDVVRSLKFAVLILGSFSFVVFVYLMLVKKKHFSRFLPTGFLCLLIFLTFFDLFRMGYRFLTFSNEKFLYPELPVTQFLKEQTKTSLGRVYGIAEPELATHLGIYTIETYNPLYLVRTASLLQALQQFPPDALSADNKYFLTSSGDVLKHAIDVLGTEYVVNLKEENPSLAHFKTESLQTHFVKVYSDEKFGVYKNLTSYPRFGLFYDYTIAADDKQLLNMITKRTVDFRKTLILEEELPFELETGTGSAKLTASTINEQTFTATTDKPALFFISDAWYPGWKVTVNDNETKLYRAHYALRAVLLPAGESQIRFSYEPRSFLLGIIVSGVSLFLLTILSFLPTRRTTSRKA